MRRIVLLIASVATCVGLWIIPRPAAATAYCGFVWGSLDKENPAMSAAPLTDIRSGRHDCYDRLIFDLAGSAIGYRVGYVDEVVMDASGTPVPLRGGAFLHIVVLAPANDTTGNSTYRPSNRGELVDLTGYRTFRQAAWAGSFEGQTTVGLGVRTRLPFRIFILEGPGSGSRVVLDVAHFW